MLKVLLKLSLHDKSVYRHIQTHDYGPLCSIAGLGTNMRHEPVSPHSVAGPSQLVPLNIAQSDYEQALSPKKGSDTSLGAQTRTGPHVPSHSEDESSYLILINTAQNVYEGKLNVIDNPEDPPNSESVIPMRLQYIVDVDS